MYHSEQAGTLCECQTPSAVVPCSHETLTSSNLATHPPFPERGPVTLPPLSSTSLLPFGSWCLSYRHDVGSRGSKTRLMCRMAVGS